MKFGVLRGNRDLRFWGLHSMGWIAYGLALYVGSAIYVKESGYEQVIVVATASGWLLSAPLRYLYRRLWDRGPRAVLIGAITASWLLALARAAIINSYIVEVLKPAWAMDHEPMPLEIFSNTIYSMLLLLCWSGLYFGIKTYERLQLEREATLAASALAQEAQLKMLRYQLNPHFLFNTLNAISTLVLDGQNRIANLAVSRLSEFLRYTLDQDPMKKVTLRQELDALNLYLGIEKLRFGERLKLEFDVDERSETALVPSLLLQPLVENSMKYAIAPREEGGSVTVIAGIEGSSLRLAVVDDGPGLPVGSTAGNGGRGVGLRNTRERLQVLYGGVHRVEVTDAGPGLRVEMRLPLEI